MYLDKNVVRYYFDSVHNEEMSEQFIEENMLESKFKEKGWTIQFKTTPVGNNLDSRYTWYILKEFNEIIINYKNIFKL